jgi:hypothetical protein
VVGIDVGGRVRAHAAAAQLPYLLQVLGRDDAELDRAPHGVSTTSFIVMIANIVSSSTIAIIMIRSSSTVFIKLVIIMNVGDQRRARCRCSWRMAAGICASGGGRCHMAGMPVATMLLLLLMMMVTVVVLMQ